MSKIQINILSHTRCEFLKYIVHYLTRIKPENREKIQIAFFVSGCDVSQYVMKLRKVGINSGVLPSTHGTNYMGKINAAILTECEYSWSMDDDILISNHVLDYMIENVDVLNNEENLFLSPLISNGIPSVDMFVDDFFNEEDKDEIHNIFKNFKIDDVMWGVDYHELNDYTVKSENWNSDGFYSAVSRINHHYKGIHPVRPCYEAHQKLAEVIINNFDKFENKNDYYLQEIKKPYFCNSTFIIKTDTWRKIITDHSLFRDGFDEVPLNLYKDKNDMNMVFVRNGYCIHMAYNTLGS